jgi:hypothetical protein
MYLQKGISLEQRGLEGKQSEQNLRMMKFFFSDQSFILKKAQSL